VEKVVRVYYERKKGDKKISPFKKMRGKSCLSSRIDTVFVSKNSFLLPPPGTRGKVKENRAF
jgi:hypothetical protein